MAKSPLPANFSLLMSIDFSSLEQALTALELALNPPPRNDRERDGAIQRFEYTFELCWKTAKRFLKEAGIDSESPKSVIRDMGHQKWVDNVELWLGFLKARNASSHSYHSPTAEQVFKAAEQFSIECRKLLNRFKMLS